MPLHLVGRVMIDMDKSSTERQINQYIWPIADIEQSGGTDMGQVKFSVSAFCAFNIILGTEHMNDKMERTYSPVWQCHNTSKLKRHWKETLKILVD